MRAWIAGSCAVPTVAAVLFSWALLGASPASATNIVLLLMDDAAASDAAAMPTLQQLAREGASFDHAYNPSPMCAPGRAILQSGQYSQNNGVTQNGYRQFVASGAIGRTFATALRGAGVDTRFVGKYINGAPAKVPGWDSFAVQREAGDSSAKGYYDYTLNIDGKNVAHGHAPGDYSVDVERDLALQDINAAATAGRPFLTMLSVHSPHNPLTPAPRYLGASGSLRQRTLLAVDDALKAIVGLLKQRGLYDSTYLVVTSDQGLAFHRDPSKGVPYEGSINVPLVIRGPGVGAGVTLHQLVSLADLAPTFLDWTGAPARGVNGRSLVPLLRGSGGGWRQAVPITHERMSSAPNVPTWQGVRTTQYAYWKFQGGGTELYDMSVDPEQRHNIAGANPSLTQKLAALSDKLAVCGSTACRSLEDQGLQ
jgi:N-acetylglucosamine-6-sulfatase